MTFVIIPLLYVKNLSSDDSELLDHLLQFKPGKAKLRETIEDQ